MRFRFDPISGLVVPVRERIRVPDFCRPRHRGYMPGVVQGRSVGSSDGSAVHGYTITSPNSGGYGAFEFTGIVFAYSDDNSAYTTIDTQAGLSFGDNEKKTINTTPPAAKHRYFRWTMTGASNAAVEVGEMEVLNSLGLDMMPSPMTSNTTGAVTVIGSHDASNAYLAFDNTNTIGTSWWGPLSTGTVTLTVDFGVPT